MIIKFPLKKKTPQVPNWSKRVRCTNGLAYTYTILHQDRTPRVIFLISPEQIDCLFPTDAEVTQTHFFQVMCADFFAEWQDEALTKSVVGEQTRCFEQSNLWLELIKLST